MDNSKKVCEFYAKNNCRKGTKCKFLHTDNGPSPQVKCSMHYAATPSEPQNVPKPAVSKAETSKRASKGKSGNGKEQNKSNNPSGSGKTNGKSTGNQGANQAKTPKPSTPGPSLPAAATNSAPKPEPSPAWESPSSYGATSGPSVVTRSSTSNGHDLEKTPRPSPPISLRSPQSDQPVKKTNKICPHFRKGSCWKGDKCPHLHDNTAVAASPAPSTLSELVLSPAVSFDKFALSPELDRKGKAPTRGSNASSSGWSSSSPQPSNGNVAQAQQRSTLTGFTQSHTATRSTPTPNPPQTPSIQFKPVISSWSYDSDEEEEAILGVKRTPETPIEAPTLEYETAYPLPSPATSAPEPEEMEKEHEPSPASTQSTPLQQTFELGEEERVAAVQDVEMDLSRDEAGPLDDSVDPIDILSQNGNGHAREEPGKESDPVEGVQLDGAEPDIPLASLMEEDNSEVEDEIEEDVVVEDEMEEGVVADDDEEEAFETRDVNDLGTSTRFDWSAEVEENGRLLDSDHNIVVAVHELSANDENHTASKLLSQSSDVNNHINSATSKSEDSTKLEFVLENNEEEGAPLEDTYVSDEHEIDQRNEAEIFVKTENEATTTLFNSTKPELPFYYEPSSSPSSLDSTPTIPAFTPPAVVDRLGEPIISSPPINDPEQTSSFWGPPAPQMALSSATYAQFAQSVEATAAKMNQSQVPLAMPLGSSTNVAVAQPTLLQQPYNSAIQQQPQTAFNPYQIQQPQVVQQQQVNLPATLAPPYNLHYPFLQIPQLQAPLSYQPLIAPMVMQPIIQQQPIFAPYIQSSPMYNPPLTHFSQPFPQQQQPQQQHQQSPHWTQFADPQARSDVPFCKLLAQGNCPSGNACTCRHALTIQEFTLLFHDRQPALLTVAQTHPWHRQAPPPQVPNAPAVAPQVVNYSQSFSHTQSIPAMNQSQTSSQPVAPAPAQPPKPTVCIFYPTNRCTNGDNCPYLHVQSDSQLSSSNSNTNSSWGKKPSSFGSRSRVPCKFFFLSNRRCDNSQCTFSHDQADAPSNSDPPDFQEDAKKVKETAEAEDSGWGKPTDWAESGWGTVPAEQTKPSDADAWGTPSTQQPPGSSTDKVDNSSGKPPRPEYVNGKKRCLHYQRGSCWKGDNCKFAHNGVPNGDSSNEGGSPSQGGSAHAGTPLSQTSSESRKPGVVDFDDTNHRTNLDDFGQATLGQGNEKGGAFDAWGGGDANTREHGAEEKLEVDIVKESQGDGVQYEPNGINGEWGAEPENGEEDEIERFPENEEITGNGAAEEIAQVESIEEEPIVFHHPEKDYTLWNSVVRFGPDITPDNVITSAESRTIIISNLPPRVPIPGVRHLVETHGKVKDIRVAEDFAASTSVQVDFPDVSQAMRAFVCLNNQTFQERKLGVKLKSRSPVTARLPALRCSVKVNWPLSSVTAYCYYQTITLAKQEVQRLNGTEIQGRTVSVTFDSPRKNQKDRFVMNISNLPPDITVADLETTCHENPHIVLIPQTYEGDVTEEVKLLCHECGDMDTFEVLPFASTHKKFTAFATFTSEAAADHAIKRLHGTNQKILKEKPLQIRAMYYARYRLEDARFKVLEKSLQDIQGEGSCQVHWSPIDGEGVVLRILAPGDRGSIFQEVSATVLKLLEGRVVRNDEGQTLWHEYFETSSSSKLLSRLSTEFPIHIHCNQHARHLRMIGSSGVQDQVESRIRKTLDKPIRNLTQRFTVTKPQIGALINGLLEELQGREEVGASKLVLNATEGIMTLWGGKSSNVDEIVTAALKRVGAQQFADGIKTKDQCQVCGLASVQPIQLSCRHSYCRNCLIFVIRNTTQTPILCLGKDEYSTRCFAFVPFIMIRELIPSDEKIFLRSCLASYVGRSSDFFFCPTLDCEAIYRTGEPGLMIKCSRCRCDLCPSCKTWSHVGLDCADVRQNLHSTADSS